MRPAGDMGRGRRDIFPSGMASRFASHCTSRYVPQVITGQKSRSICSAGGSRSRLEFQRPAWISELQGRRPMSPIPLHRRILRNYATKPAESPSQFRSSKIAIPPAPRPLSYLLGGP